MQSLYGTGSGRKPPAKAPQSGALPEVPGDRGGNGNGINPTDDSQLCSSNIKIDAIFTEGGSTYVFKGNFYIFIIFHILFDKIKLLHAFNIQKLLKLLLVNCV